MSDLAEVHFCLPTEAAAPVANLLLERVGSGIEQRDPETLASPGDDLVDLVVWVPATRVDEHVEQVERLIESLRAMGTRVDPFSWRREATVEQEWRDAYKKYFRVTRVGRRFVVKPSWEELSPQEDDLVIEIDPGMAFGTGTHASTRLALRAIERHARLQDAPHTVLDLGCGAGILGIAAARIWPECRVLAIDNDPIAVDVSVENVANNALSDRITVKHQTASAVSGRFDLMLANLDLPTLTELKPALPRHLATHGRLIVSGLLSQQAVELGRLYTATLLLETEYSEEEDGWRALLLRLRD